MKTISIINYKGGVGKTTLTANLAGELAYRGAKVLAIDLDPQASLTFSFIRPEDWVGEIADKRTMKSWFSPTDMNHTDDFSQLIITPTEVQNYVRPNGGKIDLVSSHLELINVDLELATMLGGASTPQINMNFVNTHSRLRNGLNQIPDGEYDIILIDCPPNFNIVTKNAIVSSDAVLIPAKPDYLSTMGITYLQRSLDNLKNEYNFHFNGGGFPTTLSPIDPQILGVVFTMVQFYGGQPISALRPFMRETAKQGLPVFRSYLRENKSLFADAGQYGVPVVLGKRSPRTDIISEIESLVTEFTSKL